MTSEPSTTLRTPTLEDAWERYSRYDHNASNAQKRYVQQRKLILALGVAATTLAIFYSILETRGNLGFSWLPNTINNFLEAHFLPSLHVLVVLVPILSTALIAYSLRFNMGVNWIALRSSAEAVKKEIYLYRMQVGEYSPAALAGETREVHLAKKVKLTNKRLMETQVNQTGVEAYKGPLPPKFSVAEGDDGFSDMTAEQYLAWRLEDQFSYYQRKSVKFSHELQRFQLLIILLGGLGTALAAFSLEIWVAVSGAFATAFATFLEFKQVETTVISCNTAAADLYDVRTWWRSLSDATRASFSSIETLVHSTEAIVQSENAGWVQEMRDALAEIYSGDKDEITKKETFSSSLGDKFGINQQVVSGEPSYSEPPAEQPYSEQPYDAAMGYTTPSAQPATDLASPEPAAEAFPVDLSSPEAIPRDNGSLGEQSLGDVVIPRAEPSDPFSDPPAEPVVHHEPIQEEPIQESTFDASLPDSYLSEPYSSESALEILPQPTLSDSTFSDTFVEPSLEEQPLEEQPSENQSEGNQPEADHREEEPSITTAI